MKRILVGTALLLASFANAQINGDNGFDSALGTKGCKYPYANDNVWRSCGPKGAAAIIEGELMIKAGKHVTVGQRLSLDKKSDYIVSFDVYTKSEEKLNSNVSVTFRDSNKPSWGNKVNGIYKIEDWSVNPEGTAYFLNGEKYVSTVKRTVSFGFKSGKNKDITVCISPSFVNGKPSNIDVYIDNFKIVKREE